LSGHVARTSTVDHRGKLASAESRPQSAAAPPAVGAASTLSLPLASLGRLRPCNPSRAEPPPRPGIEINLASVGLEGVGRVYAAATVDMSARTRNRTLVSCAIDSHPPLLTSYRPSLLGRLKEKRTV